MQLFKSSNPYPICKLFLILLFIGFHLNSFSQGTMKVCDRDSLLNILTSVPPGTTVIVGDTTWSDLNIRINGTGTPDLPIILKSETVGGLILTGNSTLQLGGEYVIVDGITFTNGVPPNSFVVEFGFDSQTPCSNCSLQNITIDDYDVGQLTSETKIWVRMRGHDNEVAHCSFLNRDSRGAILTVDKDSFIVENHKIHHNLFAHRTPIVSSFQNGQEGIRIGTSETWNGIMDAECEVYNNYFYDWFGEAEVISNKSNNNQYYNNTFDDYMGALTLRHGNNCDVYNNFFLARNQPQSGGIRVVGEGHKIYNNYIDSIFNGSSNALGGINITNGESIPTDTGYQKVIGVEIVFNTIVGGDKGIRVGTNLVTNLVVPPENCIIANNLMQSTEDAIEWIDVDPDTLNSYLNNTRNGGSWGLPSGFGSGNDVTSSLLLDPIYVDGFRHVLPNTIALDEGVGSFPFVDTDIVGGARPNSITLKDAGAEEFGVGGINRPYIPSDINILIGAGSGFRDICHDFSLVIPNLFIPDNVFRSNQYISADGIIRSKNDVEFRAKDSIMLNSGFETIIGAMFEAIIEECIE